MCLLSHAFTGDNQRGHGAACENDPCSPVLGIHHIPPPPRPPPPCLASTARRNCINGTESISGPILLSSPETAFVVASSQFGSIFCQSLFHLALFALFRLFPPLSFMKLGLFFKAEN